MLGALSHACPELSSADIHRTSFHNLIGGVASVTGKEFVHYSILIVSRLCIENILNFGKSEKGVHKCIIPVNFIYVCELSQTELY